MVEKVRRMMAKGLENGRLHCRDSLGEAKTVISSISMDGGGEMRGRLKLLIHPMQRGGGGREGGKKEETVS